MTHRFNKLLVASLLSLTAGHGTTAQAQHMRAAGFGGGPGRGSIAGSGFVRQPGGDSSFADAGRPGAPPYAVIPLNDVVSRVQERFNATAVKTDTISDGGQVMYRIRLLSADRSRVWTVIVDARTGQMN